VSDAKEILEISRIRETSGAGKAGKAPRNALEKQGVGARTESKKKYLGPSKVLCRLTCAPRLGFEAENKRKGRAFSSGRRARPSYN
jgi:hypothetical protein